jgi:hypothetical protein
MAACPKAPETHYHGPENAEHELRKAYYGVVEIGTTFFWDRKSPPGVAADESVTFYKRAFHAFRHNERLEAERWARAVKHLARAFSSEARIAYLEPRSTEIPFLERFEPEEYGLFERIDTTEDLLNSLQDHVPPGLDEMPEDMRRYLSRARKHLEHAKSAHATHELLKAERIKAAHEYGRVVECMALAYEAEARRNTAA